MVNLVELEPGSVFPCTATRTSSSGVVLRGEQVLVIDGIEYPLGGWTAT